MKSTPLEGRTYRPRLIFPTFAGDASARSGRRREILFSAGRFRPEPPLAVTVDRSAVAAHMAPGQADVALGYEAGANTTRQRIPLDATAKPASLVEGLGTTLQTSAD